MVYFENTKHKKADVGILISYKAYYTSWTKILPKINLYIHENRISEYKSKTDKFNGKIGNFISNFGNFNTTFSITDRTHKNQ